MQISPATQWVHRRNDSPVVHSRAIPSPIGSMVLLYMVTFCNIYHQYTPVMLAYIPAPWIRHGSDMGHHRTKWIVSYAASNHCKLQLLKDGYQEQPPVCSGCAEV